MQVNIKADIKEATRQLTKIQKKQIPYATSRALNETANRTAKYMKQYARRVFHKPTRYTIAGIRWRKTNKKDLTSYVYLNDWPDKGTPQSKYLHPQIHGGGRALKASELAFRRAGILPPGKYLAPSPRYMNSAGNIKPGLMQLIMSQMHAFKEVGYSANETATSLVRNKRLRKNRYFLIKGYGIFVRQGDRVEPVLHFIRSPRYKAIFPFHEKASKHASKLFKPVFRRELAEALRTAK